jgi:hypothetical protein
MAILQADVEQIEQRNVGTVGEVAGFMATPHDNPPSLLYMLTVYLDESGHESPEHVVIAGFVGRDEQWNSFLPDWKATLHGRPGLHMKRLRWNHPVSTGRFLSEMAAVPYRHGLTPVIGAVRVSDYADMLTNAVEEKVVRGYMLALYPIIVEMLLIFPGSERIKWVFEEQAQYEPIVHTMFRNFTELRCKERMAGIEFIPKDSSVLTQPADFLAYAVLQQLRDSTSERTRMCNPILGNERPVGRILDREMIRGLLSWILPAAAMQTYIEDRLGKHEEKS